MFTKPMVRQNNHLTHGPWTSVEGTSPTHHDSRVLLSECVMDGSGLGESSLHQCEIVILSENTVLLPYSKMTQPYTVLQNQLLDYRPY